MKVETVLKLWEERNGPIDPSLKQSFLDDPDVEILSHFTMKVVAASFEHHTEPFDAVPHADWLASGVPVEDRLCRCDSMLDSVPGHHLNIIWNGQMCVGYCQCGEWTGNAGSAEVMFSEWLLHAQPI